ncbi:uncharacterized protein LOC126055619 [Helicoverpa armigera]|uniref:uncharacterized protein LOC126055619 n=1 Tax=Helicoverpa armigera TaxID=29058 RepID=UPI00211236A4|nr:uncharacterized protein LOC126055619 [Helicoverpa armigera]
MKKLLVLLLLAGAATAACIHTDLVQAPEMIVTYEEVDGDTVTDVPVTAVATRTNISVGTIGNSRLIARSVHVQNAVAKARHVRDISFRSDDPIKISAIRVTHVGSVDGATSSIKSGGVGNSFVVIRLQTAVGRGYHYTIEIYGR